MNVAAKPDEVADLVAGAGYVGIEAQAAASPRIGRFGGFEYGATWLCSVLLADSLLARSAYSDDFFQ